MCLSEKIDGGRGERERERGRGREREYENKKGVINPTLLFSPARKHDAYSRLLDSYADYLHPPDSPRCFDLNTDSNELRA